MKHTILSLAVAATLLASCGSSRTTTTSTSSNPAYGTTTSMSVPAGTQSIFMAQYPTAQNVNWSLYNASTPMPLDWELAGWPALNTGDYVVHFYQDGSDYYGFYDVNGNWIGTTSAVTNFNSLPRGVNYTLSNQFNGYSIENVQRVTWKGENAYQFKLKNGDNKMKVLIDDNGNVLRQKNK